MGEKSTSQDRRQADTEEVMSKAVYCTRTVALILTYEGASRNVIGLTGTEKEYRTSATALWL